MSKNDINNVQEVSLVSRSAYLEFTSADTFHTYKCSARAGSNPTATQRVWQIIRVTVATEAEAFMEDLDDPAKCDSGYNQRLYNGMFDTIPLYLDSLTPCVIGPTGRGANLVTNGDFALGTDWALGKDWSIAAGIATCAATAGGSKMSTSIAILTDTKEYRITYDVTGYVSGGVRVTDDATMEGATASADGTYTEVLAATATGDLHIESVGSFIGSIDNLSVELLAADSAINGAFSADTNWTKASAWTIAGGVASCLAVGDGAKLNSTADVLTDTVYYRISYDVLNYAGGGVRFTDEATLEGIVRKANGSYSEIVQATATGVINFISKNRFTGDIDNVVIEALGSDLVVNGDFALGTDWDFVSGFIIAGGLAACSTLSDGIALITSTDDITVGDEYVIMYDVLNYAGGGVRFEGGGVTGATRSASGTAINEMFTALSTGPLSLVTVGSFVGDIDNVILMKLS